MTAVAYSELAARAGTASCGDELAGTGVNAADLIGGSVPVELPVIVVVESGPELNG